MIGRLAALVAALALASLAGAAGARPLGVMAPEPGDMGIGNPSAPVKVIEYGSVGCPHCAVWANTVFPAFKARYVDTGRVRFVVREMTTGDPEIAAAGFLLARCAGEAKYFAVIDQIYRQQDAMFQQGAQPIAILVAIGKGAGLTQAQIETCLNDQQALSALNDRVQHHVNVDGVDSTPTFLVDGQRLVGEQTLDQLTAAIRHARVRR